MTLGTERIRTLDGIRAFLGGSDGRRLGEVGYDGGSTERRRRDDRETAAIRRNRPTLPSRRLSTFLIDFAQ